MSADPGSIRADGHQALPNLAVQDASADPHIITAPARTETDIELRIHTSIAPFDVRVLLPDVIDQLGEDVLGPLQVEYRGPPTGEETYPVPKCPRIEDVCIRQNPWLTRRG